MAYVADHLSVAALEERHEACEDVMSSRHFQTIWLLAKGRSTGEVAAMTGAASAPKDEHEVQRGAVQRTQLKLSGYSAILTTSTLLSFR